MGGGHGSRGVEARGGEEDEPKVLEGADMEG